MQPAGGAQAEHQQAAVRGQATKAPGPIVPTFRAEILICPVHSVVQLEMFSPAQENDGTEQAQQSREEGAPEAVGGPALSTGPKDEQSEGEDAQRRNGMLKRPITAHTASRQSSEDLGRG